MGKKQQQLQSETLRYWCDILFSWNTAIVLNMAWDETRNWQSRNLNHQLAIQLKVNQFLHLTPASNVGGYSAFLAVPLVFALCIFLVLRILRPVSISLQVLRLSGLVSISLLPGSQLYVGYRLGWPLRASNLEHALLVVELLAAMTCAVAFLYDKWPVPLSVSRALLILHFGLWTAVCFGRAIWQVPIEFVFPISGLCASLAWAAFILGHRQEGRF
jgi:hypothetical protein